MPSVSGRAHLTRSGHARRAGSSIAVVRAAADRGIPLLGVCLGHQAIGEALRRGRRPRPGAHARADISWCTTTAGRLYAGLGDPFTATRYHSLAIVPSSLPDSLVVSSRTDSGVIMGVAHRTAPIEGVQFHPESVLTEGGTGCSATGSNRVGVDGCRGPRRIAHPAPLSAVPRTRGPRSSGAGAVGEGDRGVHRHVSRRERLLRDRGRVRLRARRVFGGLTVRFTSGACRALRGIHRVSRVVDDRDVARRDDEVHDRADRHRRCRRRGRRRSPSPRQDRDRCVA